MFFPKLHIFSHLDLYTFQHHNRNQVHAIFCWFERLFQVVVATLKFLNKRFFFFLVTFKDDRCGGAYNPSPKESLMVTHTGAPLSSICRDMSFSGWDYDNSVEREVCVRVTDYKMDCSQKLEYREGTNRGKPSKVCLVYTLRKL